MKSEDEIHKRIETLKQDERLTCPVYNVGTDIHKALTQLALETEIITLEWVLKE
jgi:hypothetical protein